MKLPAPLPFDGVELEEAGSQKYVSKINAQTLIAAARHELKPADPEAYKAFLLSLFAGMRKAEIDSSGWRMVDFATDVIRLCATAFFDPGQFAPANRAHGFSLGGRRFLRPGDDGSTQWVNGITAGRAPFTAGYFYPYGYSWRGLVAPAPAGGGGGSL